MSKENSEPTYYKPSLSRSLLRRIQKLFNDFDEIGDSYDYNPVKFLERAILNQIDLEENSQMSKKKIIDKEKLDEFISELDSKIQEFREENADLKNEFRRILKSGNLEFTVGP